MLSRFETGSRDGHLERILLTADILRQAVLRALEKLVAEGGQSSDGQWFYWRDENVLVNWRKCKKITKKGFSIASPKSNDHSGQCTELSSMISGEIN